MPTAAGLYYFGHEVDNLSRPPVVLIHGAGGHHLYWPPQIRRLHNHRVYALDLPGHGKSEGIGHHSIDDYVTEVMVFIKALKLNSVILVGHSMGGAIALSAAVRFPKRVLALGLLGSAARLRVSPIILQRASDPAKIAEAIRLVIDLSFAPQSSARLRELAAQRMAETRPAVLYGDFLACDDFNITDQLSRISTPTIILCGAEDKMTPIKDSEFLRDHITGARLDIVSDAGHMLMLEQPDLVAEVLADFLDPIVYRPGR